MLPRGAGAARRRPGGRLRRPRDRGGRRDRSSVLHVECDDAAGARARRLSPRQSPRAGAGRRRLAAPRGRSRARARCSKGLGARVSPLEAPFEPEAGAYGAHHRHDNESGHGGAHPRIRREAHVNARRLLQLASPALPVGAYSYSQGLEAAVEAGIVRDAASAQRWIGDVLELSVARMEAPIFLRLVAAWRAGDDAAVRALERRIPRQPRDRGAARRDAADGLFAAPPAARPGDRTARPRSMRSRSSRIPRRSRSPSPRGSIDAPRGARGLSLRVGREPGARRAEDACRSARPPASASCSRSRERIAAARRARRGAGRRRALQLRAGARARSRRATKRSTAGSSGHETTSSRFASASAGRSARARPRSRSRCARRCATATTSPWSPTTSTPRRTRSSWCATRRSRPSASSASRPAAARTPRSARTRRSTSRRWRGSNRRFPALEVIFIESGGDNLAATFSPELSDLTLYVIDVAAGDKIPRKGGPGITKSRPAGHQQDRSRADGRRVARGDGARREAACAATRPFVFTNLKTGPGAGHRHPLHRDRRAAATRAGSIDVSTLSFRMK